MTKNVRDAPATRFAMLCHADDGGVAIEYGLVAALIAGAILLALTVLGSALDARFSQVGSGMNGGQALPGGNGGSATSGLGSGNGGGSAS